MAGDEITELLRAVRFAAEKHRDHRRKGEIAAPYINHPIAVAVQLAEGGFQNETKLLIAAVLHDVVEDTQTTAGELRSLFGREVAAIVMEVTDDKALDEKARKRQVVENIARKSREARLLKLSDLIANVYDVIHHPPDWSHERKQRYLDWGERVVAAIRGIDPGLESQFGQLLAEGRRKVRAG